MPYSTDTILKSSEGSATMVATTAGTTALIPSSSSGRIHVTSLVLNNGATANGWMYFGYGVAATAPTTSAILMQDIIMPAATTTVIPFSQPLVLPANTVFLVSAVTCTTISVTATYYIAP